MKYPNFKEEKKLWKKGYGFVVGLDEAGRGPLAGPVVAAAVIIKNKKPQPLYRGAVPRPFEKGRWLKIKNLPLRDSKKLTPKARERFYKILTTHPAVQWATGRVSERVIDKINILEATKLAMKKATEKLKTKNQKLKIDYLILDGKMKLNLPIPQESIVKADEKVFSCACASILAKVTRDRIMQKYHKKYPGYRFDRHKGYGTKFHRKMLKKYGRCAIHRRSFRY